MQHQAEHIFRDIYFDLINHDNFKSNDQIESMIKGGKILRDAVKYAEEIVSVGKTTQRLNDEIEEFIVKMVGSWF